MDGRWMPRRGNGTAKHVTVTSRFASRDSYAMYVLRDYEYETTELSNILA